MFERKFNLTPEENVFVAKRNLVDYIWKSAKLEGLGVTFPDTEAIFNGMSVANIRVDDIIAVNNLKRAWQFLLDTLDCPSDFSYLCELNRIVGGDNLVYRAGFLRNIPVTIGGTPWIPDMPIESVIKENLSEIINIDNPTERSIVLMLYCMRAQVFLDGNKRTAMLFANHEMIRNGCGILSVPIEKQPEFTRLLINYYTSNGIEGIKSFVYKNCIDGLELDKQRDSFDFKEVEGGEGDCPDRD